MLNNNLIGFDKDKEFLPKDFDEFNSVRRLRQLFLNLSNNIFRYSCRFSKYEQNRLSIYPLKSAFLYTFISFLPISFF